MALYYQQQNNLLGLSGQNEQNALQITALESQIHTRAANFDNQIYQMELQRYELQRSDKTSMQLAILLFARWPTAASIR